MEPLNSSIRHVRHLKTAVGDIAYVEEGHGPAALFVHAAFLNGYQWRDITRELSSFRRTISVDLLAHGETTTSPGQDLSFSGQALMIDAFCDALQLDQVDLIANNSGGGIDQIFASRHPERTRTLTLTNCDTHDNWPPEQIKLLRQLPEAEFEKLLHSWIEDPGRARTMFSLAFECPEKVSDFTFRTYLEPLGRTPESVRSIRQFFLAADNRQTVAIEPILKRLTARTLIIWGLGDPIFDVNWAYWLRDTIPGVRKVIEIHGARLFFPEERPEEVAAALREHWEINGR
jgi:pimeloyl-ACP methyl ester carboxylesterase